MKKIALVLIAIFVISAVSFAGDMAKSGSWGVQTSLGVATGIPSSYGFPGAPTVGMKFWVSDNMAVRAEVGYASVSPASGGNSASAYNIGGAFEYHMAPVAGGVSPYVGLGLGYSGVSFSGASNLPSAFNVMGFWGGEYFFSSNFSLGGQIGIGYTSLSNQSYTDSNGNPQLGTASQFGTTSASAIFTWYLSN